MNLSIIIPLLNESESLPELHSWIVRVMTANHFSYEVIFIDDGSTDNSWKLIETLSAQDPNVKGIRFLRNYGKSQALHAGFAKAQGDVIITMDADLQDSPDEIPELYHMITDQQYDLVSGWKKKRYDSVVAKNLPSKLFNWAELSSHDLMRSVTIVDSHSGSPEFVFIDPYKYIFREFNFMLSISHDPPIAGAVVVAILQSFNASGNREE